MDKNFEVLANNVVLDVGCGPKDRQIKGVEGIDTIDFGQKYVGDFLTYKFEYKFDIIIAHHVVEHIPDTVAFFDKVGDLLKKDGIVDIRVPTFPSEFAFVDPTHVKFIPFPMFFFYFTKDSPAGHYYSKKEFEIKKVERDRYEWEGHIIMKLK